MPEYYVGIDLGTTNTGIAVLKRGAMETLPVEGEPICPSVIHFQGAERVLVGRQAKARMMLDPEHTIVSPKRNMGRLKFQYDQYRKNYTPAQISSFILKKVKAEAEKVLGPVRRAVITVPAYFNDDQRAATKEAGEMAGFEVLRLLSEPTAAAIAYGLNQGKDQTIAVYDLGGGTFDISILEVKGNTFTVKAVGGNNRLGGDDFDRALADHVEKKFREMTAIDLANEPKSSELLGARQKLTEACETGKKELSDALDTVVEIPNFYKGHHLEVKVTRDTFEGLIAGYVNETVKLMRETLDKAGLSKGDIDRVILVGGSTYIPMVRRKVAETIKEPYVAEHVMEMVTRGAAIVAAQYMAIHEEGDEMIKEIVKVSTLQELAESLQEIYPFRLGIATAQTVPSKEAGRFFQTLWERDGMSMAHGIFSEIVGLGHPVPLEECRDGFSTLVNNQREVRIEIYRTAARRANGIESCRDGQMRFLGDFILTGLRPAPAGEPKIAVTMAIDTNGILKVRAEEEGSSRSAESQPIHLQVERNLERLDDEANG